MRKYQRAIARANMIRAGITHLNRRGYAVSPKIDITAGNGYKNTLTSVFALNWLAFLPSATKPRKRDSRKKVSRWA